MKKTVIITLLLASCLPASFRNAQAQDVSTETFRNSLAIQPLYWLNNGFRVDYERQLKSPQSWLQISAIGYYVEDENSFWTLWNTDNDINNAWGVGIEANYKFFPFERQVFYVSAGLSASRFSVQYDVMQHRYLTYEEEGLTYYESQWDNVQESQHVGRFGTNFYIGVQNRPVHRFLIDAYAGFGRIYSFYDKDKHSPDNYLNSLCYRGMTLTLGFRVGFRL
jgi:hypothetical protein